ncbi:MAG: recombinase family protein [Planctomycetes bacterium]|nr:recombinase family protein [Planctomycetota bacterium]
MKRSDRARGLFYSRDSGGKHEMTPSQYVGWAQKEAQKHGVAFSGKPAQIDCMIRDGVSRNGDLFLDYCIKGHVLSRAGLNAMLAEIANDLTVSHVFIPRRDRLARPNDPIDGVKLENIIRRAGVAVVYMERVCAPLARGSRQDIGDLITALVDFEKSGKDRRDLAERIIFAQIKLAELGFSTVGRAPFGFCRWLAKADGTPVRQLEDGERVRRIGHHVVWRPVDQQIENIKRILVMLESMPASRVAAKLTEEGLPSPDAGRCRMDNGVRHQVSGVWHATTIVNIARNRLLLAVVAYGRRSMGDQMRVSATGPRELTEADFRADEKPKVIRNSESEYVLGKAKFEPCVDDVNRHQKLLEILDSRAGSQRGKPRSRDPESNPLGCRVFDMGCAWPMYRVPYAASYKHRCGLYMQSHGAKCAHNTVDGPTATRFVLSCLRQRLGAPKLREELEQRLRAIALGEVSEPSAPHELAIKRTELKIEEADLNKVSRNLALADDPQQYEAISKVFDELKTRKAIIEREITDLESQNKQTVDVDAEVDAAMGVIGKLVELGDDAENGGVAREIFDLANARLFLRFQPKQVKRRVLNKIVGGVVTFGTTPPPIELYTGPTGRRKIKGSGTQSAAEPIGCESPTPPERISPGGEGESLGNRSRGDWI